jgi:hypothetical protein
MHLNDDHQNKEGHICLNWIKDSVELACISYQWLFNKIDQQVMSPLIFLRTMRTAFIVLLREQWYYPRIRQAI